MVEVPIRQHSCWRAHRRSRYLEVVFLLRRSCISACWKTGTTPFCCLHSPVRPFPLEVNHCCSCRLHALMARDLVSEWVILQEAAFPFAFGNWCATVANGVVGLCRSYTASGSTETLKDAWLLSSSQWPSIRQARWLSPVFKPEEISHVGIWTRLQW